MALKLKPLLRAYTKGGWLNKCADQVRLMELKREEVREICRVTMGHLRVTIGHLRVTVGHPRVTIGHRSPQGKYGSP